MISQIHGFCLLALAGAAIATGACHSPDHSAICGPIRGATRVTVHSFSHGNPTQDYDISDAGRVRDLMAFANLHREVSRPSLYTMPASETTAAFYHENEFIGAFGVGSNFFFVSCANWNGVHNATDAEIGTFTRLVGILGETRHP